MGSIATPGPSNPGEHIAALREERGLRPADVERHSRRLAAKLGNLDYLIPHNTLSGIESGSTPTIYKLAALALILDVRLENLLLIYGIHTSANSDLPCAGTRIEDSVNQAQAFLKASSAPQTELVHAKNPLFKLLPTGIRTRLGNPNRFSYAFIGLKDDILWDVLPAGSFVEIDRSQNEVTPFTGNSLSQRPIYCLWHGEGHVCCWCDQADNMITIVPHPLSRQRSRQLRTPRDVTVIGRMTNFWQLTKIGD
jgi:transcriptional regulator with XRE-family HTH domain